MSIEYPYYVYRHIRPDTGQVFYVGLGKNRRDTYRYERAYAKHDGNSFWMNIVNKLGGNYITEIMMEFNDLEECKQKEIELIALYGRRNKNIGTLVNLTDGGDGLAGFIATEEYRQKKREQVSNGKHPNFGKKLSAETCRRKSEALKGTRHFMYGKTLSDEWKDNIRKSKYGSGNPMFGKCGEQHHRAKVIINLENGIVYFGINEAAKAHNINPKTLYQYIDGTRINKTSLVGVN